VNRPDSILKYEHKLLLLRVMGNELFYILGGLLVVYFLITVYNKRQSKRRKSRSFMEGRKLRDRSEKDN
jgi:hypothetical protein